MECSMYQEQVSAVADKPHDAVHHTYNVLHEGQT